MEVLSFNDETENKPKKKLISWSSGKSNNRGVKSEPKKTNVQPKTESRPVEALKPVAKDEPRLEMPKAEPKPFVFPKIEPEVVEDKPVEPKIAIEPEVIKAEPKLVVEPVVVKKPEPVAEPVVVKAPEPVAEPVVLKVPEPVAEPVVIKETAPAAEPVAIKEPEPVPEVVPVEEPKPVIAPAIMNESVRSAEEFNPYADTDDSIEDFVEVEKDTETGKDILSGLSEVPEDVIVESDESKMPSLAEMEAELDAYNYQKKFGNVVRNAVITVVVVAAFAVIVAMMFLPILQIDGSSMSNTLSNGDIVVSLSHSDCKTGDVVAFYYNNNILVKRVIASPGQWVDIEDDGSVYVDGALIDEPYVTEKAFGDCNITLPYQVPDGKYFVMGDHRSTSIDSRNTSIGCIATEMVIGKVICRVWPLTELGTID